MGVVATDATTFFVTLGRRAVRAGVLISELNAIVHVVADALSALPTGLHAAEQGPCKVQQLFGVAVATCQQERKDIIRQIADSPLPRTWAHFVRQTTIFNDELAADL
jgi:hypothetical protein